MTHCPCSNMPYKCSRGRFRTFDPSAQLLDPLERILRRLRSGPGKPVGRVRMSWCPGAPPARDRRWGGGEPNKIIIVFEHFAHVHGV